MPGSCASAVELGATEGTEEALAPIHQSPVMDPPDLVEPPPPPRTPPQYGTSLRASTAIMLSSPGGTVRGIITNADKLEEANRNAILPDLDALSRENSVSRRASRSSRSRSMRRRQSNREGGSKRSSRPNSRTGSRRGSRRGSARGFHEDPLYVSTHKSIGGLNMLDAAEVNQRLSPKNMHIPTKAEQEPLPTSLHEYWCRPPHPRYPVPSRWPHPVSIRLVLKTLTLHTSKSGCPKKEPMLMRRGKRSDTGEWVENGKYFFVTGVCLSVAWLCILLFLVIAGVPFPKFKDSDAASRFAVIGGWVLQFLHLVMWVIVLVLWHRTGHPYGQWSLVLFQHTWLFGVLGLVLHTQIRVSDEVSDPFGDTAVSGLQLWWAVALGYFLLYCVLVYNSPRQYRGAGVVPVDPFTEAQLAYILRRLEGERKRLLYLLDCTSQMKYPLPKQMLEILADFFLDNDYDRDPKFRKRIRKHRRKLAKEREGIEESLSRRERSRKRELRAFIWGGDDEHGAIAPDLEEYDLDKDFLGTVESSLRIMGAAHAHSTPKSVKSGGNTKSPSTVASPDTTSTTLMSDQYTSPIESGQTGEDAPNGGVAVTEPGHNRTQSAVPARTNSMEMDGGIPLPSSMSTADLLSGVKAAKSPDARGTKHTTHTVPPPLSRPLIVLADDMQKPPDNVLPPLVTTPPPSAALQLTPLDTSQSEILSSTKPLSSADIAKWLSRGMSPKSQSRSQGSLLESPRSPNTPSNDEKPRSPASASKQTTLPSEVNELFDSKADTGVSNLDAFLNGELVNDVVHYWEKGATAHIDLNESQLPDTQDTSPKSRKSRSRRGSRKEDAGDTLPRIDL